MEMLAFCTPAVTTIEHSIESQSEKYYDTCCILIFFFCFVCIVGYILISADDVKTSNFNHVAYTMVVLTSRFT